MKPITIGPLAGIDNASERDDALQVGGQESRIYLRDAVNVVIDNARASMRKGLRLVTPVPYTDLWQSTLHGDAFARLGDKWVKVNTSDWSHEVLATVGDGPLSHLVLNGKVLVAAPGGLFEFDGRAAKRLVLDVPPGPMLAVSTGDMVAG